MGIPGLAASMWALVRSGGGFVWDQSRPVPQLRGNHVLLRVRGAAINPVDYKAPAALMGPIVGLDVSGVVEAAGDGSAWRPGDEVFGRAQGSLAQFALSQSDRLARKPPSLSWAEAAALPTAHLTGIQSLRDHAKMARGDRVLVIGASGGTGLAGLQLARLLGASEVVGVCSGANADLCREHGADGVLDYRTELAGRTLAEVLGPKSFDVVYDCATGSGAGEDYKSQGRQVLRDGRTMVAINGGPLDWIRALTGCTSRHHKVMLLSGEGNTRDLDFLAEASVKPLLAEGFDGVPLNEENVKRGFEQLKSRRTKGKIAFTVAE
mmetsp:Transcript_135108/g.419859  ORF Transcript_135108/g.419859 Transcript_135108/m.419859 type:complete len:322 (-) Transcript_135108:39-1004(-)